jgi:hypothetical protein
MTKQRYFLTVENPVTGTELGPEEVTLEQFIKAEQRAGFFGYGQDTGHPATAGFSGNNLSGFIKFDKAKDGE